MLSSPRTRRRAPSRPPPRHENARWRSVTKLATITRRIESRDDVDIAALLRAGFDIDQGVAALLGLYGNQANGLQSVKAMVWFGVGGLDRALPADVKQELCRAAARSDARIGPLPKRSLRLD